MVVYIKEGRDIALLITLVPKVNVAYSPVSWIGNRFFLSYVWQDLYFYDRACMMVQHITFFKSQLIIFMDFFENYFFTYIFIVFPPKKHNILTFPA